MPMKIEGLESIATMFSVLHDGGIRNCAKHGENLEFGVDIQYLAERVNPSYRTFKVTLGGVKTLSFTTWPDDATATPDVLTEANSIFTKDLEILSAEVENNSIKVSCNQPLPRLGYCGGFLNLQAESAVVRDEAGKEYSIEDLCSLSSGYWDEWARKNKA